jgi:hypothetical protein
MQSCRPACPCETAPGILAAPEAIYTHFNISNGFFNSTYLMTPTPDPKTVSAPIIGSRAHAA